MEKEFMQNIEKAIIVSSFFKEAIRKAWSAGHRFDEGLYVKRCGDPMSQDDDSRALKFEEWWTRTYNI